MRIQFVKQYRGAHSVDYEGYFTSGFKRISGTFYNGQYTFEMNFKEPTPDSQANDKVWDVETAKTYHPELAECINAVLNALWKCIQVVQLANL